ncbi:MAG: hypothetical protein C4336_06790 [Armatimonadota bacterium]
MLKKPVAVQQNPAPTVRLITLGCAKNEVDSEEIAGVLAQAGYRLDGQTENPDIVIINTCGFIESAKREGLQVIREAVRQKRAGHIRQVIVAGCLVQREGETLRQLFPDVDAFVGVGQMARFAEIRAHLRRRGELIPDFDLLIGATALVHDLTVLTFNLRHFQRIPELKLYQPG